MASSTPFNGNELVADADHHHSSAQHRGFKPAENTPILARGVRTYHAIEQLLDYACERYF